MSAKPKTTKDRFVDAAEDAAAAERDIQHEIDRKEKARPKGKDKPEGAMQAGARRYPEPPFPKKHLGKPGAESELDPAPMYDAPHYKGSEKLDGKVALITGGDSGIGRAIAVCSRARAQILSSPISMSTKMLKRPKELSRRRDAAALLFQGMSRIRNSAKKPWPEPLGNSAASTCW
jgi:hypothetical protein